MLLMGDVARRGAFHAPNEQKRWAGGGFCRLVPPYTFVLLFAAISAAQEGPRTVNPREFGLDLPPGVVTAGEKQAVTTVDDDGQPVVGRIHARIGNAAVILLPDGELVGRNEGQYSPTDRRFDPLDKDK